MMGRMLPEAFENGADVVADSELVIEFTGGTRVLNICQNTNSALIGRRSSGDLKCQYWATS